MLRKIKIFYYKFGNLISFSLAIFVAFLSVMALASVLLSSHDLPVKIKSLDPDNLGIVCANAPMVASVEVNVTSPTVITYYFSVMNKTMEKHLIGTQDAYRGLPYPTIGKFFQSFPWTVPNLPPGTYARVFAAVGTNGYYNPEEIVTLFKVRPDC